MIGSGQNFRCLRICGEPRYRFAVRKCDRISVVEALAAEVDTGSPSENANLEREIERGPIRSERDSFWEHFQEKWIPVRRQKMRPRKENESEADSIKTGFAPKRRLGRPTGHSPPDLASVGGMPLFCCQSRSRLIAMLSPEFS
jgi:hypothetical protein